MLKAVQGYSDEGGLSFLYPAMLVCSAETFYNGDFTEDKKRNTVENSGAKSCKDFMMIWRHIYEANLKVSKELLSSGEPDVPGIVACKINDNLLELMGHKLWNKLDWSFP